VATPDRDRLADGLVSIGEDAISKKQRCIARRVLHGRLQAARPEGDFNRDEIKAYFAALRDSFTDFTIARAQILVDGNFVTSRTARK
jgi:hypothetical protein